MSDMASLMAGMSGMDMGSNSMFADTNAALARSFWWIVLAICGFAFLLRILNYVQSSIRLRISRSRTFRYPTQPRTWWLRSHATFTAVYREVIGPEIVFRTKGLSWLSPPALGKSLLLLIYWAVIIYMLTKESIIDDAYYWERIGFRAAWTSASQVPLVYLLAQKASIIGFLTGASYERLNWVHRWVSRTLLITVTIHGAFFFREWWLADFIALELSIMPMVKYGIGAWFLLLWTTLSSLAPIRQLSYELFVIQHLAAAAVFLWLLYIHIPSYAQYWIWIAVGAVVFDKAFLWGLTAWENFSIKRAVKFGHRAEIRTVESEITEVIVHDVGFSWTPGQHVHLRIPTLGPFETHPFTVANVYQQGSSNSMQLLIKAKSGFTRRLAKKAQRSPEGQPLETTALVTGPFGYHPDWKSFETLVLISASTGSTFTLPVLDSILQSRTPTCVTRIDLLLIARNRKQTSFHLPRLSAAQGAAANVGVTLNVSIATTCPCDDAMREQYETDKHCNAAGDDMAVCKCGNRVRSEILLNRSVATSHSASSSASSLGDSQKARKTDPDTIAPVCCTSSASKQNITVIERQNSNSSANGLTPSTSSQLAAANMSYTIGSRPDLRTFVRGPVEASGGETCVVVCGGRELVAEVRCLVSALSDERAVHKGTGAQGIAVWGETYSF